MSNWYYHDPAQGRMGPLTGEQLRTRYRERLIQGDTLVWREGMREWQALDSLSAQFGLADIRPDPSQPPPLPPKGFTVRPDVRPGPPPKKPMSGCLIALIVCAAVGLPVIGILAAIAIPAYQDYTIRAKVTSVVSSEIQPAQDALLKFMQENGAQCPLAGSGFASPQHYASAHIARVRATVRNEHCTLEFELRNLSATIDGNTIDVAAIVNDGELTWDCTGGTLPARYRPKMCRISTTL